MNSKMQNKGSLEQQVQIASSDLELLKDEELEAITGFDDLLKNLSLRGKVARWAAVTASVVGISIGMVMPAHAVNNANGSSPHVCTNLGILLRRSFQDTFRSA